MAKTAARTEKLDLRITPQAKGILQRAASAMSRSVSDFVIESALARAEETLPDRRRFGLEEPEWEAFQSALDNPPRTLAGMGRLLTRPSVFESDED